MSNDGGNADRDLYNRAMKTCLILLLGLLLYSHIGYAESLRCGSKIVDIGINMDDVKKYCGSPSSSSIEEQDVRSGNRVVGTTQIHIWRYKRSSGQRTAILEFDQNKLRSITYESK